LRKVSLKVRSGEIKELLTAGIETSDESYSLKVLTDSDTIQISANQYVGLVRGMATLA
jgi:beta-acetyl hexosaminidase like